MSEILPGYSTQTRFVDQSNLSNFQTFHFTEAFLVEVFQC